MPLETKMDILGFAVNDVGKYPHIGIYVRFQGGIKVQMEDENNKSFNFNIQK